MICLDPHISCSSSVISEFNRKLYDIDHSLSLDMQPAVGFLCLAVCPKSCIYPRNVQQTPTVMCCYNGLCDFSVTQRIAVSLLLHFLCLVGCLQNFIDELQRIALESQLAADVKDINQLPPDSKKKFDFHEFLLSIYRELPDDDRKAVISLTSGLLKPPRHPNYTASLIVHFIVLMEGKLITPVDLHPLQDCLHVIGQFELLDKIDRYYQQAGLVVERRARPSEHSVPLHAQIPNMYSRTCTFSISLDPSITSPSLSFISVSPLPPSVSVFSLPPPLRY